MRGAGGGLAAVVAILCGAPAAARAWMVEDPLHAPCHERMSAAALAAAGYVAAPPPLGDDDARLRSSLQFDASRYDANIYALSLIIGARWPDSQGEADFDFYDLSGVHNAAATQDLHCLRAAWHDGATGDAAAVQACRAAVERSTIAALASLDELGGVAPDLRTPVPEYIPFVGKVDVPLSTFYANAGIALHIIEDSFAHTYRDPAAPHAIWTVFNWVDQIAGDIDEARDGHGHEGALDDCDLGAPEAAAAERRSWAEAAATEYLQLLNEPGALDERVLRLRAYLDRWFAFREGCTLEDEYCRHPIQAWFRGAGRSQSEVYGGGCSVAGGSGPGLAAMLALVLAAFLRRSRGGLGIVVAAAVVTASPLLWAAGEDCSRCGKHLEARVSLSVDRPAYAARIAGSHAWRRFELGGFVELNPWFSVERRMTMLGVTNIGVEALFLHRLRPDLHVRAGLDAGVSILNVDWYGSDAGTTGVYLGFRLLGLVWQASEHVAFTVDAYDLALPAPQLKGWPIMYGQHRLSFGIQY